MRLTALTIALLLLPLPARGHPTQKSILGGLLTTRPIQEWELAVRLEGALTPTLVDWYNDTVREKPKPEFRSTSLTRKRTPNWSGSVEQWQPLVSKYFQPPDIPWAMRVMACESGGNPLAKNPRSSASGLFQHLARYWPERSAKAGWAGADIFDPEANIAVASWLYYTGGPGHWVCK